jgi:hypothetical protein
MRESFQRCQTYPFSDEQVIATELLEASRRRADPKMKTFLVCQSIITALLLLVPETGIEPVWTFIRGILSPLRLPIPPLRQRRIYDTKKTSKRQFGGSVLQPRKKPERVRLSSAFSGD